MDIYNFPFNVENDLENYVKNTPKNKFFTKTYGKIMLKSTVNTIVLSGGIVVGCAAVFTVGLVTVGAIAAILPDSE